MIVRSKAIKIFKFRLYPSHKQEQKLLSMIDAARRLWNDALAHRNQRWREKRLSTSYPEQSLILTARRRADPALRELYSQAAQDVLRRLDKSFKAFFEGIARYPRFKSATGFGSFTYPQAYNGSVKLNGRAISLSKIGNVPAVLHREVPPSGKLKTCTIKRELCSEWYAVLTYEVEMSPPDQKSTFTSPIGIDLGLMSLIATSDGKKIQHPQFLRRSEKRLKRLQRKLSRRRKGSKNREKARLLLAVQYAKVAREREDFNHKLTTELVNRHDAIFFEDLKIRSLVKNHSLAKSINDAGWGQILRFAEYKERCVGGIVETVPAVYSTQECFFCGTLNPVPLSVREFNCASCERKLDRDLNAARIMLKRGCAKVGQDKVPSGPRLDGGNPHQAVPELTPAEIRPLPVTTTGLASPVNEAGTTRRQRGLEAYECGRGGCHEADSRNLRQKRTGVSC